MRVSLHSITELTGLELPPVEELVKKINAQLGGVEEVIDLGAKYRGIVIVKVVSCEPHPDSDHLHLCEIDTGDWAGNASFERPSANVQVVCGAPNIAAGQFVVWLPPGSTVPATFNDAEPFVLGSRNLRGVMSNGMIASARELAIGDDHEGIVVLTDTDLSPVSSVSRLSPGLDFAETFGLDDTCIDIENKMFTHRPDLFGQLGVAREISAILKGLPKESEDVGDTRFVNPDWYWQKPSFEKTDELDLHVTNEIPKSVPRLMAVGCTDVTVKPSPFWLQCELVRLGSKPINNVVDATNYSMLLTAQPTHAYDYDKLRGHTLLARMALDNERLELLNGKTYELTTDDIVIADSEGAIGLAGIMGGGNSEVSQSTKNIVLEVANFDMYTVRKSAMRHGVFTDALTRFNKGQSPLQNDRILAHLLRLVQEIAGAKQATNVFDMPDKSGSLDEVSLSGEISLSAEFVNERLGLYLSASEIGGLLRRANFASYPRENNPNELLITAPFWRTDIVEPEDIVEEVGRLYGFDKLPQELPLRSIQPALKNPVFEMRRKIGQILSGAGANEVKTYSFVHERVIKNAAQDPAQAFRLSNALSPDLQYYRLSLLPSLLDKVHMNIKAGHDEFALYEFGKSHNTKEYDHDGLPREVYSLACVYAAKKPQDGAPYYHALRIVRELLEKAGIHSLALEPLEKADLYDNPWLQQMVAPFDAKRTAVLRAVDNSLGETKNLIWGVVGEFTSAVSKSFKLPEYCAAFELDPSMFVFSRPDTYVPLSRFPYVTQDISLRVPATTHYRTVYETVQAVLVESTTPDRMLTLTPLDIYQAEHSDTKTFTFRLTVADYERTLTDQVVSGYIDRIARVATEKLGAEKI